MDMFAMIILMLLLVVNPVKSDSDTQVQELSGFAGQGSSFFLMQHVFKLEGKFETKLKHMEEEIEELKSKVIHLNGPQEGNGVEEDIAEMESEIENLSQKLNNAKSELQDSNSALRQEIIVLQERNSNLQSAVSRLQSSANGNTYIRWGRTDCPQGTEMVYRGSVGGSHYSESGAGVDFLCLTDDPEWGYYDSSSSGAYIYGGEYEFGDFHSDGGSKFFGKNLEDMDALCVVCRSPRTSVVMIPGRKSCFAGWTFEYSGYLVTDRSSHAASEFICLDKRPQPEPGSYANNDGKIFYMAEGKCGSLNCPPYIDGRELTCVVCSK